MPVQALVPTHTVVPALVGTQFRAVHTLGHCWIIAFARMMEWLREWHGSCWSRCVIHSRAICVYFVE